MSLRRIGFLMLSIIMTNQLLIAQNPNPILFTYGNNAVTKSEFEYVYQKNNANKTEYKKDEIRDYLDLYIKFKLKVKAAEDARIDTVRSTATELRTYQNQLMDSYIEKKIIPELIKEEYERMQSDVRISHIMVALPNNPTPDDTLPAYKKILNLRSRLLRGESFAKVAREASDDKSAASNGGDLGFFTALQIPFYQFESVAYQTPVGKVSMPVRTKLGYHLIKPLAKRPAIGTIQVAHILIGTDPEMPPDTLAKRKALAYEVYNRLKKEGADAFEGLAKKYSTDNATSQKGGLLPAFGAGKMVVPFDSAAYALFNPGSISKPVKTQYGWHILKLVSRESVKPLDDMRDQMEKQIKRMEAFSLARERLLNTYKKELGFIEFPDNKKIVVAALDSSILKAHWKVPGTMRNEPLFLLGEQSYRTLDMAKYIQQNQTLQRYGSFEDIVARHYKDWVNSLIMEKGLSKDFEDFAWLKKEYRDGIMLFALTEREVWNKANTDTVGLNAFYETNKDKYMWGDRMVADVYLVRAIDMTNDSIPKKITDEEETREMMEKVVKWYDKKSQAKIIDKLREDDQLITVSELKMEKGKDDRIDALWDKSKGMYSERTLEDGTIELLFFKKKIGPEPKLLREIRGFHVSDYQNYLEQRWVEELEDRYPVKVNENVFQTLFQEN